MWFDSEISATKSHYIVLAVVTLASYVVKSLQIDVNDNIRQSMETFMEDLYETDKDTKIMHKPAEQNDFNKKIQIQNVPPSVVVMMKLISYYEDKFRIANHEPTERGTTVRVQTESNKINVSKKVMQRIGFKSKDRYDNIMIPDVIIA